MTRPALKIAAPELRLDPERLVECVDWQSIFGDAGLVEIEIGPGKGRFLLTAAATRPDVNHLGIEWANKYLRIAESRALRRGLRNIRFVRTDAAEVVRAVREASVQAYYVFYPDPWPKKRHHKRRFLQRSNADELARTLIPGGWLHVATDHRDYWEAIEPLFDDHGQFERAGEFGGGVFPLPVDEPLTNFEAKYRLEGRSRYRASWSRRPDPRSPRATS